MVLIAANLLPLVGVLALGWDVLGILLLYWAESVVLGLLNVLRMARCEAPGLLADMLPVADMQQTERLRYQHLPGIPFAAVKLFLIPFFIVHYGMFCFAHLTAVVALFGAKGLSHGLGGPLSELWQNSYWIALAAIAASHLYSFFCNFLGNREYQRVNVIGLMQRPYGRIVAMHLAILLGGALVAWLGDPIAMLLVLIGAKTWLDSAAHNRERLMLASPPA